jgi:hypothetical protein
VTDNEIVDMATVRLKYLQKEHGLNYGEFDVVLTTYLRAVAIVHEGVMQHIILHDTANNFRKKIKP